MSRIFIVAAAFALCAGRVGSAADPKDTEKQFNKVCATCHGKDGKAQTDMGKELGARDLTDPAVQAKVTDVEIEHQILNGSKDPKKMPPLKDKVTPDQAKELVKYVRAFKGKK